MMQYIKKPGENRAKTQSGVTTQDCKGRCYADIAACE